MKKICHFILSCFLLSLVSCGYSEIKDYSKKANSTNKKFYNYLNKGEVDSIVGLFSDDFLKKTSRDTLLSDFTVMTKFGVVVRYDLVEASTNTTWQDRKKKITFEEVFKVEYSGGFISKEKLTFLLTGKDSDFNKISGYSFNKYD